MTDKIKDGDRVICRMKGDSTYGKQGVARSTVGHYPWGVLLDEGRFVSCFHERELELAPSPEPAKGDRVRVSYEATYDRLDTTTSIRQTVHRVSVPGGVWNPIVPLDAKIEVIERVKKPVYVNSGVTEYLSGDVVSDGIGTWVYSFTDQAFKSLPNGSTTVPVDQLAVNGLSELTLLVRGNKVVTR